ncbi:MAG: hypothetical protein QXV83_02775 [Candidatus Anstonellaceae archaeon]
MNKKLFLFLIFVFLTLYSGCVQQQGGGEIKKVSTNTKDFVEQQLNLAGLDAMVESEGEEIVVSYEVNRKNFEYEGEFLADWGAIFGILLYSYPKANYYTIEQRFMGQRIYQISIDSKTLKDYKEGKIDSQHLKEKFIIKK